MSYEARCILVLLKQLLTTEKVTRQMVLKLAYKIAEGEHLQVKP